MPAPTTLTVNDRAATPVAHDFIPGPRKDGVQYFLNSDGVKIGDKTITISQRQAGTKYKPRLVFTIPVVQTETINGIASPKVVRTAYADLSFTFDEQSSTQERSDLIGFVQGILDPAKTTVDAVLSDLEWWNS